MDASITPSELVSLVERFPPPAIVDVRRNHAFAADPVMLPGAIRHDADAPIDRLFAHLEPWRVVVVYCGEGHEDSADAAARFRARGITASQLQGGLAVWRVAGGATRHYQPPSHWVTRERPKIDRIACPWLVRRFIDPAAVFHYVPAADVAAFAARAGATPFDVPDVLYSHAGDRSSFDAFLRVHALADPALSALADIVRGADTDRPDLAPQAPGLLAASLGLTRFLDDDAQLLRWGMLLYDALYAWCRSAREGSHGPIPDPRHSAESA